MNLPSPNWKDEKVCRRFLGSDNMTDECVICGFPERDHYIDAEYDIDETPLSSGRLKDNHIMTTGNGSPDQDTLTLEMTLESIVGALTELSERLSNIEITQESILERLNNLDISGDGYQVEEFN